MLLAFPDAMVQEMWIPLTNNEKCEPVPLQEQKSILLHWGQAVTTVHDLECQAYASSLPDGYHWMHLLGYLRTSPPSH